MFYINALTVALLWLLKAKSLPKLYHGICNKRDVQVSDLRALEKQGHKIAKLKPDIKFFNTCLDLKLCSQFLKFRDPSLTVYKNNKDLLLKKSYKSQEIKELLKADTIN